MAIQGDLITAAEFNSLWQSIKSVILDRLGVDSLGQYCQDTTSYEVQAPASPNLIQITYYNSISLPLRVINTSYGDLRDSGNLIVAADWNKLSTSIAGISEGTSCVGSCAGLCSNLCAAGCSSGCGNGCSATCGTGCSGNCANSCGGCRGCTATCGSNCTGGCNGCSGGCTGACGGCGSSCSSICRSSCSGQCVGCTQAQGNV